MNSPDRRESFAVFSTRLGWFALVGSGTVVRQLTFAHPTRKAALEALDPDLLARAREGHWNPSLVARLKAFAAGSPDNFLDVPVDFSACTAFERRVFERCREIPLGETMTYGQLAAEAGSPRAARAVGRCMAGNRVAIIVPCHRVVGSGGGLGGYSAPGGTALKRRLLELEASMVASRDPGQRRRLSPTRREFLRNAALGAAGLTAGALALPGPASCGRAAEAIAAEAIAADRPGTLIDLGPHLAVYQGAINVGIVRDGSRALLVDCGDGSVAGALRSQGLKVEQIILTHHHRDQACGAHGLVAAGAKLRVPAAERDYVANVAAYWQNPKSRWHLYNQHPHHLMLAEPVAVEGVVAGGLTMAWGPAAITVLATPGHTDGSVSYAVEVDGKRTVFSGDAIYDEGQIWELYSLQKGTTTSDYHGFLGARPQLVESLRRIQAARPDWLVPSHGRIMDSPARAIDALVARLELCYDKYVAISALRHYFPKMFADYAGRKDHMPIRPGKPAPDCLRHFGTTWMLVSKDRAAFVMDCGTPNVVKRIQDLVAKGEIGSVEGLWVTHYHDDHVDAIPAFQQAFDCPLTTDRHVAEVIADPLAWRLPCISPSKARVDRATKDGDSWTWHEFRMTAYHLPGQTLYHSGLLVESGGLRMFFVGDSFTMAGIDDYCAHNRNWLGRGVGFDHCIELIEKLRPTHLFNCHVGLAWDFTPQECRFMGTNLAEREKLYGELFPWDHPNYGMDEPWVRCHPYEQNSAAGSSAEFRVVITNHSTEPRKAACRAVLPRAWAGDAAASAAARTTPWTTAEIPAKEEGRLQVSFRIPADAKPGRYVVPVDVRYHDRILPQFTEGIVVV